jgi:hypothetical protein
MPLTITITSISVSIGTTCPLLHPCLSLHHLPILIAIAIPIGIASREDVQQVSVLVAVPLQGGQRGQRRQ